MAAARPWAAAWPGLIDAHMHLESTLLTPAELAARPVSAPQRRLTQMLADSGRPRRLF